MTRAEFWFLEAAVSYQHSVRMLGLPDLDLALNRKPHGLNRKRLIRVLYSLLKDGHVHFRRPLSSTWKNCRFEPFVPTLLGIEEALDRTDRPEEPSTTYGLTAQGGAIWETIAKPDWLRFYDESSDMRSGEIIAGSKETLRREIELLTHWGFSQRLKPETVKTTTVCPWKATYWKTLPTGHRTRFRFENDDSAEPASLSTQVKRYLMVEREQWCRHLFGPV